MSDDITLPDYVGGSAPDYVEPRSSLSRPTASQINRASEERVLTLTGFDEIVPVTYGEDRIPGLWLVKPFEHNGEFLCAVLWGWGPAAGVQRLITNGADVPGSVTVTHYTGAPGQGIDPTLSAAIPGFADDYEGWAYTVLSVPPGAITGFPDRHEIEAVFRGRLLYDSRTDTTGWSENPGLFMADFIASTDYGPDLSVYGGEAVADRCDSLVGGVEVRCRAGVTLRGQPLSEGLDLLASYAEALWDWSEDGVLLVPDAPVDTPTASITPDMIVDGTLRLTGRDLGQAPTVVSVTYKSKSGTAEVWSKRTATQQLPGVGSGEVAEIRSDVNMPGIRRETEADRKALMRIRRLRHTGQFAFQLFDEGAQFERGDVVKLLDLEGLNDPWVRLLSIEMVELGIYQVTAEQYDDAMYPDSVPVTGSSTVPVGGVLLWLGGSQAPSGYDFWNDANGRFLMGAGTQPHGTTDGSTTVNISGVTDYEASHTGDENLYVYDGNNTWWQSGTRGVRYPDLNAGGHEHPYSGSTELEPIFRRERLIVKTNTPGDLPIDAGVLADGQLVSSILTEVTAHVGRLIKAGSPANGGSNWSKSVPVTLAYRGEHEHEGDDDNWEVDYSEAGWTSPLEYNIEAGGHRHPGSSITLTFNLPRIRLALYGATSNGPIETGDIIGYIGTSETPQGYAECDGNNGTPDMRDSYIELSTASNAGQKVTGSFTVEWDDYSVPDGKHNHGGGDAGRDTNFKQLIGHETDVPDHTHRMTGSQSYKPPTYYFRFIQYIGAA